MMSLRSARLRAGSAAQGRRAGTPSERSMSGLPVKTTWPANAMPPMRMSAVCVT